MILFAQHTFKSLNDVSVDRKHTFKALSDQRILLYFYDIDIFFLDAWYWFARSKPNSNPNSGRTIPKTEEMYGSMVSKEKMLSADVIKDYAEDDKKCKR